MGDAVEALLRLVGTDKAVGEVVNVGNDHEISIEGLARMVKERTGSPSPMEYIPYDQAYEPGFEDMLRRVPSVEKLESLTGFRPRTPLPEIVDRVVSFARGKRTGIPPRMFDVASAGQRWCDVVRAGSIATLTMHDPLLKSTTSLSVIVPAYNEQHLVVPSLQRLRLLGESPFLDRVKIIVVDDGSSDGTAEVLEQFGRSLEDDPASKLDWTFIRHPSNQGKAAAIHTGLLHADTELTVIHDADLEYHPQDLIKMAKVFLQEPADAVFGSRFLASEYRRVLFFRHEIGNRLLTLISNIVSDLNLTDMETCYKMVRTKLLKSIPLVGSGFEIEPEITIKLAKRAARIFEVPIRYSGRTYQEGKKIGVKDGFLRHRRDHSVCLLRSRVRRR